jgi:hypothetical protein
MGKDEDEIPEAPTEVGSDELLSEDDLRLPESANVLVRLHAVRAWLARRRHEASIEVGEAALNLQQTMAFAAQETRPRRRERQGQEAPFLRAQHALVTAQESLQAYEDAEALLEDCVTHTGGERVLVEYYLALEELVQSNTQPDQAERTPRLEALADVQHRVERVGAPSEES